MITYRWIDGAFATDTEWSRIDEILAFQGWPSLNRDTTLRIRVAEDGERILGFLVVQFVPHVEPLWVASSHRGTEVAGHLSDDIMQFMNEAKARGFMLVADSPHAEKLAKDRGLRKINSPVYVTDTARI